MTKTPFPTPTGLSDAGKSLWRSVVDGIPADCELDERELSILSLAAHQADDLAQLEVVIDSEGAMSTGSKGQPVVHPAIPEARQARLAIGRLLGQLGLEDVAGDRSTEASRRGRKAARKRWGAPGA